MADIIEGSPEQQRRFDALTSRIEPCVEGKDIDPRPREVNQRVVRHIMQSVIAETPYKPDLDFELWHHCQNLEAEDALPAGVTADDIYQEYLRTFCGEG